MKILYHIGHPGTRKGIGNKAASLYKINKLGFPIPESYVVPQHVREAFLADPEKIRELLIKDLNQLSEKNFFWAIRSSGEMEDHEDHSFAGQFSTFLDIKGVSPMLEAIEKVWISGETVREGLYNKEAGLEKSPGGMAVIVQKMVQPLWSGVAFSVNPVTGRKEFVIEAVQGSGVKLVQDGVRPVRWTRHAQGWDYELEPEAGIKSMLESLVKGIKKLHGAFGGAVDIEWAYDGKDLFYLQCRPVTVREFPTIFSNHISREVLPGMIKPLVWSINIPLVNSAWIRLLEGLLGKLNIKPEQLSSSFYYRAYFNMGTLGALFKRMGLPDDSLESLMGRKNPTGKSSFKPGLKTLRYLPAMIGFLLSLLFLKRKFKRAFARITTRTDLLTEKLKNTTAKDYNRCFEEINSISSEAAYYNILIPLSFQISNRVLQKKLKKRGIPFENLNFLKDYPALSKYDPNEQLSHLRHLWASLPAETRDRFTDLKELRSCSDNAQLKEIDDGIRNLIIQFGHFSESGNDFSSTPWREDPDFLFSLVRQQGEAGIDSTAPSMKFTSASKGIPRKAFLRAGRFRLYREMISSEYTRCYGLFRELFLITGKSFMEKGCLDEPFDVFYLTLDQHNNLMDKSTFDETNSIREKVTEVKKEMDEYRDLILPSLIYGDRPPPLPGNDAELLEGIPTSPGIFEGELVVVKGYEDFEKNVEGKILVIPFSDVGWTPLLVRAGAIVSESGGMLSHASIIARELSIPAISSVDHACNLKDGTKAKIDGSNGKLIIDG